MKKGQRTQKKLEFQLKNKENRQKAGLKSCFWALVGTNRLVWVVGRDVGFRSSNRDCPDEIGTVGKYVCMIPGVWMTRVAVWEKSGMCARCGRGGMSSCSTFTRRVYCGKTEKLSSCLA